MSELYDRLLRAMRRQWPRPDAEDVVQDAFLRLSAAERRMEVRDRAAFLHVTAFNLVRDRFRAEAVRRTHAMDISCLERVMCDAPSAERTLSARERLAAVGAAIRELPQDARAALVMYRLDNLPHAQIAEELGISVSMVEKHVRRALAHCRARLAETDRDK